MTVFADFPMMILTAPPGTVPKASSVGAILTFCLSAVLSSHCGAAPLGSAPAGRTTEWNPTETAVRIVTEKEGAATRFYVQNEEYCEVTMTVDMHLVNLEGNIGFPYTATFPARK